MILNKRVLLPRRRGVNLHLIALAAFATVFVIQILLNMFIPAMRSLPDEMGAVSYAAYLAGYDWTYVLTHPAMYYGNGMFPFLLPFFLLVKNTSVLLQCLLGMAAFLRAIPAFLACQLLYRYFAIKKPLFLYLSGVACAFFAPTRATNIDNEPLLIFYCWLIFYCLVAVQHAHKRTFQKAILSFTIALLCALSLTAHTRALLYICAVLFTILVFAIFTKKALVNLPVFFISFGGFYFASTLFNTYITNLLFPATGNQTTTNTPAALTDSLSASIHVFFSGTGILSFFDMLFSNLWVVFIFSGGVLFFVFALLCARTKMLCVCRFRQKGTCDNTDLFFPALFCVSGFLAALLGLAITWLPQAIAVHELGGNLSRGNFYLRYFGNFFGPLLLVFLVYLYQKHFSKRTLRIAAICSGAFLLFCVGICCVSFLQNVSSDYSKNLDWFYYFAPFSGNFTQWPNATQNLSYFICATTVSLWLAYIIFRGTKKDNVTQVVVCMLVMLLYQYIYGVFFFDVPFSTSKNYYGASNAVCALREENSSCLLNADAFYYSHDGFGAQYNVQFQFPSYQVITSLEDISHKKDNIVLSNKLLSQYDLPTDTYQYVQLDDNEFLYINDAIRIQTLQKSGYTILPMKESTEIPRADLFCNEQGMIGNTGVLLLPGGVQYGPYYTLPAGYYTVEINGRKLNEAKFGVTTQNGEKSLPITSIVSFSTYCKYTFTLTQETKKVEFASQNSSTANVLLESIFLGYQPLEK